jgi:hypothetical protein
LALVLLAALALTNPAQAAPGDDEFTKRVIIQPAAAVYNVHSDRYCTLGFLLTDPAGAIYGITGGQCAPNGMFRDGAGIYTPYVGSRTWPVGKGPVVARKERRQRPYGRYVAQVLAEKSDDLSYAIIRLDRNIQYLGAVAEVGGPGRQPFTGETTGPTQVTYVCEDGYAASMVTTAAYDDGVRDDVAQQGRRIRSFRLATPAEGSCAGAPVLGFDSTAVAIHSGYVEGGQQSVLDGRVQGSPAYRVDAIIESAQKQLRTRLRLVQAGEKGVTRR